MSAGAWTEAAPFVLLLPRRSWERLLRTADVGPGEPGGLMVGLHLSELFIARGGERPGNETASRWLEERTQTERALWAAVRGVP